MHPLRLLTAALACLLASFPAHAAVTLENGEWSVVLVPETLAIAAQRTNDQALVLSSGVAAHAVDGLEASSDSARWRWDSGAYTVSAHLDGADLSLSIVAEAAGNLAILNQPAAAWGKGLIFPLAEGSYIPADNTIWRDFLLEKRARFNTSQDISLPLWGLHHEGFSFTWILTNPFNNTARFARDGDGLALSLEHEFTTLDFQTPMTMLLHLGEDDPLAGAKRYRQWLVAAGKFEPLSNKIAAVPDAVKLIGAPHAYLWGSGLISVGDVKDWEKFIAILSGDSELAADLRNSLESEDRTAMDGVDGSPHHYQKLVLVRAFNAGMNALARKRWQTAAPDMDVLTHRYRALREEVAVVFSEALGSDPARWGGGISIPTMRQLQNAGLKHLWIGLGDGWEGGLWHPEAIKQGVEIGYLVAPYDSYETALQQEDDPSWATAHLGEAAYRNCAIGLKDGSLQAGFQQSGHYTRPDCVRPLLQARIPALLSVVPFNSWFLDAYATGMVFDSYPPAPPMTQAQYAAGNVESMRWVGEALKLPVGSEDGNATTSQAVFFAHGMQTPVIGWGDMDMQRDKSSPYFLGRWYPSDEPETFFKTVPLKPLYRTIHFDPATRLPLYQAVFHGSVITTHHWLFDSLKLTDVRSESELTQLLYNVPPLYHLSADTLKERLAFMTRQDAFFRPLHERLATQALVGFRWVTPDRQVQQTTFEDGTRLVANFGREAYRHDGTVLPGQSIAAYVAGQNDPVIYRVRTPE